MMAKKKRYILPRKYTNLGEYLQKMRTRANLTQREVSNTLGYSSAQFISNFERGIAVPPLKKLKALIKMYDMPAQAVMELILESEREQLEHALKPKRPS